MTCKAQIPNLMYDTQPPKFESYNTKREEGSVGTRMETYLAEFSRLNEMVAKNTAGLRSAVYKFSPYEQKDVESQQPNGPGALGELERQLHVLSDSARQLSEILKHLDTIV